MTSRLLREHEIRLRTTFRRLLLLSLGAPASFQACGSDNAVQQRPDGGAPDATVAAEGGMADAQVEAAPEGSAGDGSPLDAGTDSQSADSAADAIDGDATMPFVTCDDASVTAPYHADAAPDARVCYYFVDFSCPLYAPRQNACRLNASDCAKVCTLDGGYFDCNYTTSSCWLNGEWVAEAGQPVTIACGLCPGVGRRPAGLQSSRARGAASVLGAYFADASHLEAASVRAFQRLRDELRAHGAPRGLVRAAARSACDEVRHAKATARLAQRYGGQPAVPRVKRQAARTLERMARENAVEGCVRETFGAMVATWQAAHAQDEDVRRSMDRIARDETRHAALAWAVAGWAETRLDERARARVAGAQRVAVRRLARDVSVAMPLAASREAGLPTAREARALVRALSGMWA
jgi:hypothetical protein